ncbi:MAG: sulfatase-like hydrolase/transferase [Cytophagales bacterium]|nr:sulfatase-like hydrolase/transferase [Cytophagales bacterium]
MKRVVILLLYFGVLVNCQSKKDIAQNTQPNVIIILTDDQGYADVGFNGCKDIPTPNIDRIASQGVKFTNGYVSYAVCGPSRAGLITGRYQDRFGFGRNPLFAPNDPNQGLPLSEETLASALDKVGYQTMAIGKWHLGAHKSQRPLNRGFDEFFGFLTGGHQYFPHLWTLNDVSEVNSQYAAYNTKLLRNNSRIDEREYLTDALSREAVGFIERNSNKPFFLYLAYNAPHTPLQATKKYLDRFAHIEDEKRRTYAAMVSSVDDGVGLILNKLDELGIDENTMVFFLSDNGGPNKTNGSRNDPLKAGKGSLYEGGIRVPFAMCWPAMIDPNQKYDRPVISLDIFATVAAHSKATPINSLDGVNIIPYLAGQKTGYPHEHLFWRKFDSRSYAVRHRNLKLISLNGENEELYDLNQDVEESHHLTDLTQKQKLFESKENWDSEMIDPVFLGLMQNDEYTKLKPDRFNIEPY